MPKKVPYLQEEQIERDAEALLAEYERARGIQIVAPVPIEDIVEKYLKLGVEFDDMHHLLGVPRSREPDILGAMFFDERRIVIDESLDPRKIPRMKAVTALRSRMREAVIGDCTAICFPGIRHRFRC